MWAEGAIGRSEWLTARAPIEKRQTLAKKRLAKLNRTTALARHIGNADRAARAVGRDDPDPASSRSSPPCSTTSSSARPARLQPLRPLAASSRSGAPEACSPSSVATSRSDHRRSVDLHREPLRLRGLLRPLLRELRS